MKAMIRTEQGLLLPLCSFQRQLAWNWLKRSSGNLFLIVTRQVGSYAKSLVSVKLNRTYVRHLFMLSEYHYTTKILWFCMLFFTHAHPKRLDHWEWFCSLKLMLELELTMNFSNSISVLLIYQQ